jgi:hypothetical protein
MLFIPKFYIKKNNQTQEYCIIIRDAPDIGTVLSRYPAGRMYGYSKSRIYGEVGYRISGRISGLHNNFRYTANKIPVPVPESNQFINML